ncbi:hypothetical protein [Pedobacter metabolipauper]|uniref:Uncharacterized protein n=1 Tax=Pedobacter metabolipauper TaxID=425513 RepID=A0A4V3D0Z8_9SPHI|nr:hypothetical protein [Pedobacter metabolipauper]TDQ08414.1 hypothetical protein ATK78_2927 [Pedobacter metabolipauper]
MLITLTKEECISAIKTWKEVKSDYSKIESIINPQLVFSFNREQIDWLSKLNKYKNFHTYIGVHRDELILILVPLDQSGTELKLSEYSTSSLIPLAIDLKLVEIEETTKIKTTVLSQDLKISSYTEEFKLPTENRPAVGEKTALQEIESWSNECHDWFYCECFDFLGKRIFNTFTVPFEDLGKPEEGIDQVICIFAFKISVLYKRQIPTLIFIALDDKQLGAQIIRSTDDNSYDWSQPCPPFCKEGNFDFLE